MTDFWIKVINFSRIWSNELMEKIRNGGLQIQVLIVSLVSVLLALTILNLYGRFKKRNKKSVRQLGKKPINDLKTRQDFLFEIHYAACVCGLDETMIKRCILLLRKYPMAVNIPLPPNQYTPFLRACWNGCSELISYMLNIGADTKLTTADGSGPMYLAIYALTSGKSKNLSILKQLLAAGCNINAGRRQDGFTPLHVAARKGSAQLVGWLLANGADPSPTSAKTSPRKMALTYGHTKVAELLKVQVNSDDDQEPTNPSNSCDSSYNLDLECSNTSLDKTAEATLNNI